MRSVTCNLCDITFFRKVVVSLCSVESSPLVWGALESRQWYLILGSYLEGKSCGFPESRIPRRYHGASQQENNLFILKVSLSRRPTAPAAARRVRAQSRPGRGGVLKVMDGFSPAPALRELLNHGHTAGSSSSSISKNKMQMQNKIAVWKATGEILVSGRSSSAGRKRSVRVRCSYTPWLLCRFSCN